MKYEIVEYGTIEQENLEDGTILKTHYIKIKKGDSVEDLLNKKYVLFLGLFNNEDNSNQNEVLGIVINSSSGSSNYPKDSISIVDINNINQPPKSLLGLFNETLFQSENLFTNSLVGKYGLYSDNAFLKGTMISETLDNSGLSCVVGLTTTEILPVFVDNDIDYAVLFAGKDVEINNGKATGLSFYVTRNGHLHAENGYFNGIIETSTIVGGGTNTYALQIVGNENMKALRFASEETDSIEYLSLDTTGCYFYNNSESLLSVLYGSNSQGIGLFSKDKGKGALSSYGLNFRKEQNIEEDENGNITDREEIIQLYYYENLVATVDRDGFKLTNERGLGDYCECQTIKNNSNTVIGVDFILQIE